MENPAPKLGAEPKWFRFLECVSLAVFFVLIGFHFMYIFSWIGTLWWLLFPALFLGWILADLVSGIVHWAGDTVGSANTPILGPALIRPFREHHIDPKAMVKHDFVETNAASAMLGVPFLFLCFFLRVAGPSHISYFLNCFLVFLCIFALFTNQIHKWAHTDRPPGWVSMLQKNRILLNPTHHRVHHTAPFNRNYCITNGMFNPLLQKINFFRRIEKIIPEKYFHRQNPPQN